MDESNLNIERIRQMTADLKQAVEQEETKGKEDTDPGGNLANYQTSPTLNESPAGQNGLFTALETRVAAIEKDFADYKRQLHDAGIRLVS